MTRKIRATGHIPAVVYGKGAEPVLISLDPAELMKALDPDKKSNTVFNLRVGGSAEEMVMLRDWQKDALRGHLTHADFVRVRLDQDVHATVPLVIIGKAEGVKAGGVLHQVFRSLEIACTPDKIPQQDRGQRREAGHGRRLSRARAGAEPRRARAHRWHPEPCAW